MKPNFTVLITALLLFSMRVGAQIVNIPDQAFFYALKTTMCADMDGNGTLDSDVDTNNDGNIQVSEAAAVLGLDIHSLQIDSLTGQGGRLPALPDPF